MLGLNQTSSSSGALAEVFPLVEYTSDFSAGVDSFSKEFDPSGVATLAGNTDAHGKTDVLSITWRGNEDDGLFYVTRSFSDLSAQQQLNSYMTFRADIYYEFAASGPVQTYVQAGNAISSTVSLITKDGNSFQNVNVGEWTTVQGQLHMNTATSLDNLLRIGFVDSADAPVSGDKMYIHNVVFIFEDRS
tara:strand:- start:30389 stop:30955 length:567 start_codon:yes stop_codon:yes gene_type:complete